jgi:hypothetical protein
LVASNSHELNVELSRFTAFNQKVEAIKSRYKGEDKKLKHGPHIYQQSGPRDPRNMPLLQDWTFVHECYLVGITELIRHYQLYPEASRPFETSVSMRLTQITQFIINRMKQAIAAGVFPLQVQGYASAEFMYMAWRDLVQINLLGFASSPGMNRFKLAEIYGISPDALEKIHEDILAVWSAQKNEIVGLMDVQLRAQQVAYNDAILMAEKPEQIDYVALKAAAVIAARPVVDPAKVLQQRQGKLAALLTDPVTCGPDVNCLLTPECNLFNKETLLMPVRDNYGTVMPTCSPLTRARFTHANIQNYPEIAALAALFAESEDNSAILSSERFLQAMKNAATDSLTGAIMKKPIFVKATAVPNKESYSVCDESTLLTSRKDLKLQKVHDFDVLGEVIACYRDALLAPAPAVTPVARGSTQASVAMYGGAAAVARPEVFTAVTEHDRFLIGMIKSNVCDYYSSKGVLIFYSNIRNYMDDIRTLLQRLGITFKEENIKTGMQEWDLGFRFDMSKGSLISRLDQEFSLAAASAPVRSSWW